MSNGVPFAQRARKFLVAALGVAGLCLSSGLLDGTAETVVSGVLAIATALGVYQAPNRRPVTGRAEV